MDCEPIAELASLRTGTQTWADRTIAPDTASDPLAGVTADTYEINAEFDLTGATADRFGGDVRLVSPRLDRLRSAWGVVSPRGQHARRPWRPVGGDWTDTAFGERGRATVTRST